MSEDLKKALFSILAAFLLILAIGTINITEAEQAREHFATLTPEQQLRQKIQGVTRYQHAQTQSGEPALTLTIQHSLFGMRSTEAEIYHLATQNIKPAYQTHPGIQVLGIQYDIEHKNKYGEISWVPLYYVEIDRDTHARIQWQKFEARDLPHVAHVEYLK
jgi:hypothetical protein